MTQHRPLRSHQAQVAGLVRAIAQGELDGVQDILAAVTPGGGKSLLPVIAAATLFAAGMIERVVWVVPRDSLRLQAEETFADPGWREALGHALNVRAADNEADPSRGLVGYVTTYQGVAAAPELHLAEMRRHRTLLVVDEVRPLEQAHRTGWHVGRQREAGIRILGFDGDHDVVISAVRPQPTVPVRPFRDPDPLGELAFATPLAARRAIADEIRLPLARLSDEDRAFVDALLTRTLARPEILATVRERFPPRRRGESG